MSLCRLFIMRPVGTILMALAFVLAGVFAYRAMPVADLPNISVPVIYVVASQPGSSPQQMASSLTTPLERHLGQIAGLTSMRSDSTDKDAFVLMFFDDSRDINGAARDVEAALQAARQDMPNTLLMPPQYYKANPSDSPIMLAAMTSDTRSPSALRDLAETRLKPLLSGVKGVGWVELVGASKPAVRVEMNPLLLYKYGVGFEDVRSALASANANTPKGFVDSGGQRLTLETNDQARTAEQYRDLVIGYRNGRPVRLTDVAKVRDGPQDERKAGWYNKKPAIITVIRPQPGANVIEVTDAIRARAEILSNALPPDVSFKLVSDRSVSIRGALIDTQYTLLISVLLVVLVVLAFLRSWRSTLIPAITVPISLAGSLAIMHVLGFSLDTLSLMALTIATGFVVDDAIVVVENIARHMEAGMSRMEATLLGSREIAFTILSITISLIAVFLPLLLLGGVPGKIFFEFAMTLTTAVTVSFFLSISLTPMMCAYMLEVHHEGGHHTVSRNILVRMASLLADATDKGLEWLMRGYTRSLRWALRHPWLILSSLPLSFFATIGILIVMSKTILPAEDISLIESYLSTDQTSSFTATSDKARKVVQAMMVDHDVEAVLGFAGEDSANEAQVFAQLTDKASRTSTPEQIAARVRARVRDIPGLTASISNAGDINGGGQRQHQGTYTYIFQSDNDEDIYTWVPRLTELLRKSKVLVGVNSQLSGNGTAMHVLIQRDTAARYMVTPQLIGNALYDAFGQRTASAISTPLTTYYVVMEVEKYFRENPDTLKTLWVSTAGGTASGAIASNTVRVKKPTDASTSQAVTLSEQSFRNAIANRLAGGGAGASNGSAVSSSSETMVPLPTVARLVTTPTPLQVSHENGFISGSISFDLAPGKSLGDATSEIQKAMISLHTPIALHGDFSGQAGDMKKNMINELLVFIAALATMYVTLGILYESYIQPLTILSTLPSAAVGAMLTLWICQEPFSLIAMIGVILLVGIVKKNAILMIDFALHVEREQNLPPREAIYQACITRFRPILMTTLAAAFGAVPLVFGHGYGSELRRPLGIAVIGGLATSQLLTLYSTPVVYLFMHRLSAWTRRKATALRNRFTGRHRPDADVASSHPS
ncbi:MULTISPECIES: efflux RND transporter permease subunit [Acetobacter]|uniref:efflux RND transporter permease subunit n=1 Tax=Acetobacter TaxID=434 RepID=UPI00186B76E9|nr:MULTISPECIES: efflux RND transporter permease subunit [Acetobacter]MCC6105581.1 efflux RND transporter permease subunit [Acetobacter sp.]MCG4255818.1 efflux RND transporter permease subunit [Acetobacter senegalensis]MCG4265725.1 efflux RND transporter permease subunit [Acetobacter senegalensis]MCP1195674.1 efflux RND transporter permease subunit [Acetobacter senegalensis]